MCQCKNVEMGTFTNQMLVELPDHMQQYRKQRNLDPRLLSIDSCLVKEIEHLWSEGITTTGCCCGHNQAAPYIGVIEEDIPKMRALGYLVFPIEADLDRTDNFHPKSRLSPEWTT